MNEKLLNYKLIISYDGTRYCGWQIQKNGNSIQQIIQDIASMLVHNQVNLIGSGRTDAGVHASGQVANFHSIRIPDLYRFRGSLNALLPPDIRILGLEEAPDQFHARYSSIGKEYHYHIHLAKVQNPFKRLYCLHLKEKIDLSILKEAASLFIGTHDFTSFANESHTGTASYDSIRTIKRLDIIEQPEGVRLEFEGDGFLYKMIRNIVGTLLEIAAGKRAQEEIPIILSAKDRRMAGQAAPPLGLFLMKVHYLKTCLESSIR